MNTLPYLLTTIKPQHEPKCIPWRIKLPAELQQQRSEFWSLYKRISIKRSISYSCNLNSKSSSSSTCDLCHLYHFVGPPFILVPFPLLTLFCTLIFCFDLKHFTYSFSLLFSLSSCLYGLCTFLFSFFMLSLVAIFPTLH